MTDSRVWRNARLLSYGDCYSGTYWADVFDGTYDRMHPECRWFDPIGIWTQRCFDLIHRPADPGALHDPVLRELFLQTILDAGHTLDEVTEKVLATFTCDLFILLRSEAHNGLEVLPEHVLVLYRELVHTDPTPSDEELIAIWTAHIPNYVEFYRVFVNAGEQRTRAALPRLDNAVRFGPLIEPYLSLAMGRLIERSLVGIIRVVSGKAVGP